MTKSQYAKCEESSKKLKDLPEYETLVKASQLMNDGSYWGPEAEATLSPSDINIDALKIQMKLFLKRQEIEVEAPVTLADLLRRQQLPAQGIAVAFDNKVVPKADWEQTLLQDRCSITVIRAVCGG